MQDVARLTSLRNQGRRAYHVFVPGFGYFMADAMCMKAGFVEFYVHDPAFQTVAILHPEQRYVMFHADICEVVSELELNEEQLEHAQRTTLLQRRFNTMMEERGYGQSDSPADDAS